VPRPLPDLPDLPPGSLNLAELARSCRSPWGLDAYSPVADHPYLALVPGDDCREADLAAMAQRLRRLPCPVVALGPVPPALSRGVDVILERPAELPSLQRNIEAFPRAAMTLVQLLRHNEDVAPEQGLFAESLAYASLQAGPEFARVREAGLATGPGGGEEEPVLLAREGDRLYLRLNRPAARNAYNRAMRDALFEALCLLQADSDIERAVISGEGSCFSIGGDLAEFGLASDPSTAHAIRSSRSVAGLLLALAPRLEFHLHRACVGAGIELPAFAERVVAAENTFVQLPELRLGLLPGAGGTVSIPRRIGRHRTAWLALSCRRVRAETALAWGLVDELE